MTDFITASRILHHCAMNCDFTYTITVKDLCLEK